MSLHVGAPERRLSLGDSPLLGRYYSDWLAGAPALRSVLGSSLAPRDWPRPAKGAGTPAFWGTFLEHNRKLGASKRALELCAALASGAADAVVTGQQPGLLGGPLFTLLKLSTAVSVAEEAAKVPGGRPAVAVLWNAADDTDFPEVRAARLPSQLEWHGRQLPEELHQPHRMVGTLDGVAARDLGLQLLREVEGPGRAFVEAAWREAAARSADFGEQFAAFLFQLAPGWDFLVLDARLPELRASSTPVFERYLERHSEVVSALASGAGQLHGLGYEPRIEERSGQHSLYRITGTQRDHWQFPADTSSAVQELRGHLEATSANVVLRPLAQDFVLPVLTQIVGPGEAAYLFQVYGVGRALSLSAPPLFPRLSLTLWPREADDLVQRAGAAPADFFREPDALLRRSLWASVPAQAARELETFERCLVERAQALAESTHAIDPSLGQLIESARAKMDFQLSRLRDGILSKVKSRQDRNQPRLGRLKGFVLPQEKLQERWLSLPAPYLQWGPEAADRLLQLSRAHVADSIRGEHSHYLVSWEG